MILEIIFANGEYEYTQNDRLEAFLILMYS
jgi:hypothetical protein